MFIIRQWIRDIMIIHNTAGQKEIFRMNYRRLLCSQVLSIHRRVREGERLNTLSSVLWCILNHHSCHWCFNPSYMRSVVRQKLRPKSGLGIFPFQLIFLWMISINWTQFHWNLYKFDPKETLAHEETERKFLERQTLEDFGRSQIGR